MLRFAFCVIVNIYYTVVIIFFFRFLSSRSSSLFELFSLRERVGERREKRDCARACALLRRKSAQRERNTTHTHRGFCAGVYLNQREKKKKREKRELLFVREKPSFCGGKREGSFEISLSLSFTNGFCRRNKSASHRQKDQQHARRVSARREKNNVSFVSVAVR